MEMIHSWSSQYWEERYAAGYNSGAGSYGKFATYKASIINNFVLKNGIIDVCELGCGDGAQLLLANYGRYVGYDVSETALRTCKKKFATDSTKTFKKYVRLKRAKFDLSLSLDVIYHLIEDEVFEEHMLSLFSSSRAFVIIYSSNYGDNTGFENTHVRHRRFTDWIDVNVPTATLLEKIPNIYPYEGNHRTGTFADFYIYKKSDWRSRLKWAGTKIARRYARN